MTLLALHHIPMDELGAIWRSPQSEDDLKHKILLTTFELETVRMELNKIKHQSDLNQKLLQSQLQLAFEERDEAKQQLQQLLDIFMLAPAQPQTLKQNPSEMITLPTKPHSGLTDQSNNNYIDSFFDTVSSTEKSCKHTDNDSSKQYDNNDDDELNSKLYNPMALGAGQAVRMVDLNHASIVIDQLVKEKVLLPCKGRLLEAVMKAGSTLEAMMLAGPIPQWKNPPPAIQPLKFQPVLTNNGMIINNSGAANHRFFKPKLETAAVTDQTGGYSYLRNERIYDGYNHIDIGNNNKRHRGV